MLAAGAKFKSYSLKLQTERNPGGREGQTSIFLSVLFIDD